VKNYRDYFSGKEITVMGLGLLGRGVNDVKFLAECGARLTVTDLKTSEELAPSLARLREYEGIKYVLGRHRLEDFRRADLILRAAGVPIDSPYVAEAKRHGIPVEMDESLFARLSGATIIGVTGTRGKTTTTILIYEILQRAGKRAHLAGNIKNVATLPLLSRVEQGDLVVLELSSWQLQGFGEAEMSPHIAVFTNFMPDHLNYYRGDMDRYFADKANIFRYQEERDVLVAGPDAARRIARESGGRLDSTLLVADETAVPRGWAVRLPGAYNRENVALAAAAARALGVSDGVIRSAVEDFEGVPERLEFVREIGGVKYYNDTTSTIPEASIAAIEALAGEAGNIVLIAGGEDKGLDYRRFAEVVEQKVGSLVLFPGTATDKVLDLIKHRPLQFATVNTMKEAVEKAREAAGRGDVVLLSPGAASFGTFENEFDRGAQFVALVRRIE
jgi:UDP-N-acetylmuramoylalanine--D-glutamate ligase